MKIFCCAATEIDAVELSQVKIGNISTGLIIQQCGCNSSALSLEFGCGFHIIIDERGIAMRRDVLRPNHDHGDSENLCVDADGKYIWSCRYMPGNGGHRKARIEFGPTTVDY